jgi:hypothetical protein
MKFEEKKVDKEKENGKRRTEKALGKLRKEQEKSEHARIVAERLTKEREKNHVANAGV